MSKWTPRLPEAPAEYTPWPWPRLLVVGLVMLLIVSFTTVAFTLPAETGRDPTGIGKALRLDELGTPRHEAHEEATPLTQNVTPLLEFAYSWQTSTSLLFDEQGNLGEGDADTRTMTVTAANVTALVAILSWQDAATIGDPQPDTFKLEVDGPAGNDSVSGSNDGANGRLELALPVAQVPPNGTVTAATEADARSVIAMQHASNMTAQGDWTWTITLDDVADLAGDDGNDWRLQVFVDTYTLALDEGIATPIQEATVDITVPALGEWVEYKVFLAEGDTLEYSWNADAAVDYDLHGLRSSGEETSHETGNSAHEEGTLLVPFNGQHGWAWRNTGATDVTLQLSLRGPFVAPG